MTTLTVTVDTDANATLLKQMLKAMRFVKKIEPNNNDYPLSEKQVQLLEDRIEEYKKNPKKGKSLEHFKAEMKLKYGV